MANAHSYLVILVYITSGLCARRRRERVLSPDFFRMGDATNKRTYLVQIFYKHTCSIAIHIPSPIMPYRKIPRATNIYLPTGEKRLPPKKIRLKDLEDNLKY
jgi:hypothetical protein